MKHKLIIPGLLLLAVTGMYSCKKEIYNGADSLAEAQFTDSIGTLKGSASFPIGLAVEYPLSTTSNGKYWSIVKREAAWVTFGNELKNSSLVKTDGTYDFTTADNFYSLATNAGIKVFGHTLVWHTQQRATYYNTLIGATGNPTGPTNLLQSGSVNGNPGFEDGTGNAFTNWATFNGAASFTAGAAADARTGARALKVTVATDNPGGEWRVQLASVLFPTEVGKNYKITYWVKAAAPGSAAIRFSTQNSAGANASYQGNQDVSTAYTMKEFTFAAKDAQTRILLDLGAKANTYYFDDIVVADASIVPPPTGPALVAIVDNAMKKHIQTVVARYAGKITAWDVINEPFTDGGEIRNNVNTPTPSGRTDVFVWQNYLGRDYAAKAFTYARASDAAADLYMNDYNLESSTTKLDAFVTLANELKAANTGITGVGTQMHCNINTSYNSIDQMFIKLAATGLKVRISELDVRLNPSEKVGDVGASMALQNLQAAMYKYVIQSYIKHVPTAQRGGVLVWGVSDSDSWISTSLGKNDAPLLFDKNYVKKPAFAGILQGLKGN
ncbi:endo-1,4-beta-xylanase [Pedobacter frigiditerrae]|uniref:endo-1,4-beta-xylanase n=1 Tax=Pedobacter frigiditerrae TaxID=2530452 RepID=UPI00292F935B|nr:endo-1,4-beta-xylanase [Pedobacter frigiditerrae]